MKSFRKTCLPERPVLIGSVRPGNIRRCSDPSGRRVVGAPGPGAGSRYNLARRVAGAAGMGRSPPNGRLAALLAFLALAAAVLGKWYRIPAGRDLCRRAGSELVCLLEAPQRCSIRQGRCWSGGGAVAGVAMGLFALARSERERLRDALVQERIATAETEGELQAARAIQLGMVPPRSAAARASIRASTSMRCWNPPSRSAATIMTR